jgi:hypothetical protein
MMSIGDFGNLYFENNTFVSNRVCCRDIFYVVADHGYNIDLFFINNTITGGRRSAVHAVTYQGATCYISLSYNNFWGNQIDFDVSGVVVDTIIGNIYENPMFQDSIDFYLQAFSPLIDAGDPDILDVDGSRSDIGYLGGPGGRSYEYVDMPPAIPDSFDVEVIEDTIQISWQYATEADFDYYNIYRSNESGFTPSIETFYTSVDTSVLKDTEWVNSLNYYYLITAVDNQDNESDPSMEIPVEFVDVDDIPSPLIPRTFTLYQNYPNPFNPQTTISYYIPEVGAQPARVKIVIYNLLGEEVRVLLEGNNYAGEHSITWNGKDDSGSDLSSGVYFYRLFWWGTEFTKAKKMVLVR